MLPIPQVKTFASVFLTIYWLHNSVWFGSEQARNVKMAMRHVKCVAVGDSGVGENKYKYKKLQIHKKGLVYVRI